LPGGDAGLLDDRHAKLVARGGAWWVHVEKAKAELLGSAVDPETQQMIDAHEKAAEQFFSTGVKLFGEERSPDEREAHSRQREANTDSSSATDSRAWRKSSRRQPIA
jgi:hypothetical protein